MSEVGQWGARSVSLLMFRQHFQCLSDLLFMITEISWRMSQALLCERLMPAVTAPAIPVCLPTPFHRCDWKMCLTMKDDHFFSCPWHSSNHLQSHGTISTLIEWVSLLHYTQPQSVVIWGFCVWSTQEQDNTMHFFPFSLFQYSCHFSRDAVLAETSAMWRWEHIPAYYKVIAGYNSLFFSNKERNLLPDFLLYKCLLNVWTLILIVI